MNNDPLTPRAIAAALALAVLSVAAAQDAYAQLPLGNGPQATTTRERNQEFNQTDESCHGPVQVVGKMHSTETVGTTTFHFKVHQIGRGTGLGPDPLDIDPPEVDNTGFEYQYQNFTDIYEESSARNFTSRFTLRKHIIRVGSPNVDEDDLFMVETMKAHVVAGVPVVTIENSRFECK